MGLHHSLSVADVNSVIQYPLALSSSHTQADSVVDTSPLSAQSINHKDTNDKEESFATHL